MSSATQRRSIDDRELVRKSFDKIRVNNPFDVPYATIWDGFHHVVPAKSFAILERFLAEKWLEEQAKRLITETADKAVKDENQRRIKGGMLSMDRTRKTGEQYEFETPFYANWAERIVQVIKEYNLYGGVVQEYGMDFVPQQAAQDNRIVGSIIDQLETAPAPIIIAPTIHETGSLTPTTLTDALEDKSQPQLRSLAKEKGIETENTDKKADLIKAIRAA